jgi:hypothetical protein
MASFNLAGFASPAGGVVRLGFRIGARLVIVGVRAS